MPPSRRLFYGEMNVVISEIAKAVAETTRAVVDAAVDSKLAPVVATPPIFISGTALMGIPWQQWAYISATIYSVLLIIGWVWKAVRTLRK